MPSTVTRIGRALRFTKYTLGALACTAVVALADLWSFPRELTKEEYIFGDSKFILEVDGTKDWMWPPHTLLIYRGEELLAKYRNIGFQKVYASKDNRFFVGVSNKGVPGTAFVIFDVEGNLLREQKHLFLPPGLYTEQSLAIIKHWYDEKNPEVQFDVTDGRLVSVFIRGSNKQKYDLLKTDLGLREKAKEH
jgi:hypothetical protein